MNAPVKKNAQVSPYLLWFLVHGSQTGIGLLSFQSKIDQGAGYDAWLSLLAVGLAFHVVIAMILYILRNTEGHDIIAVHRRLFGSIAGNALTLVLFGYFILIVSLEVRSYSEVIQAWVFPSMPLWEIALIIMVPVIYIVSGGFRVVTGICVFSVLLPTLLLFTLYFPLRHAHWTNFLPLLNHTLPEFAYSASQWVLLFLGVEFMLVYYPYISGQEKANRWAHIAIAHTTLLYLIVTVVSFAYFNVQQFNYMSWPTLSLSKIIHFPFLERFDYIYVFTWFIVIIPICCLSIWCCTRIMRRLFKRVKPRGTMLAVSLAAFLVVIIVRDSSDLDRLTSFISTLGKSLIFGYIPALFLWVWLLKQIKKKARG